MEVFETGEKKQAAVPDDLVLVRISEHGAGDGDGAVGKGI